jgi:cytidine deaminase
MNRVIEAAKKVQKNAHAPYSNFKIGAAVETENGDIVVGCNVESSSYGLTTCAERVALGNAISMGHRKFKSMAIVSKNGVSPCGACRQVIWDLCGNIPIVLVDEHGNKKTIQSSELLPLPFDDESLPKPTPSHEDPIPHNSEEKEK